MGMEEELKRIAGKNSHSEFPLLRVSYSPTSRYPASDFTTWIAVRLAQKDTHALGFLLTQLTGANPGLGIGPEYWKSVAKKLTVLDLLQSIDSPDTKAITDLHSALFSYILHGSLDGFMLVSLHVEYLARVMSPYSFSIPNLLSKVKFANTFIRKMRKETKDFSSAWTDLPLIKAEKVENILRSGPPSGELRSLLRELSISSRLMFLGTLEDGAGQGGWKVRPFGIDEEQSTEELVKAGLGILNHDQEVVLSTYRNEELLSALAGYATKQGWKKKYIIKFIGENAPDVAVKLCDGKAVFEVNSQWASSGTALVEWTRSISTPLAVALAFNEGQQ
jgi:hypothetical protein